PHSQFHEILSLCEKVRGGRGASSSSPYHAVAKSNARLQEVRVLTSWGKGCTETRCTLQAARRGGSACLASIPLSIPGLCIITNNCVNCYHFCCHFFHT